MPIPQNTGVPFSEIQDNNGSTPAPTQDGSTISVNRREYYQEDCLPLTEKCRPTFVLEKNLTVIRKGPTAQPHLEMFPYEEGADIVNPYTSGDDNAVIDTSFLGSRMFQSSNSSLWTANPMNPAFANQYGTAFDGQDISMFYDSQKELKKAGDIVFVPIDMILTFEDWDSGDQLIIEHEYVDSFGITKKATARVEIMERPKDLSFISRS